MAHYQTTIDVEIKSGLRTWIGKQKVVVKLKPVRVKNGKVFKRPKGKSISSIRVKGNKYQNTYELGRGNPVRIRNGPATVSYSITYRKPQPRSFAHDLIEIGRASCRERV